MLIVKYWVVKNNKMLYNDVTNCNIKIKIFHQDWSYNYEEKNKSDQYSG